MGEDEEGTLARLKAHRHELIEPKIAEHHGRVVKTTGDGLLIEFPSVVEAVACALAVQRAMAERNDGVPSVRRIEFRIGVNLGDVVVEDGDIFGDGVNIAARLEGLAEPGGICISEDVFRQVRGKVNVELMSARRASKTSQGRFAPTASPGDERRKSPRPCRSQTSRRSRYCRFTT
jgi:adenylate cyclase